MTPHGWKDATLDEATIRAWWAKTPEANVAIACGPSGLAVMDADHGIAHEAGYRDWLASAGLPATFSVRTGRRPEFGVQMYFAGLRESAQGWELHGATGDIKSAGGYVMAVGSVHPDSGERYEVLADADAPVVALPDTVRVLQGRKVERVMADGPITEWRNESMIQILGKMRNAGLTDELLRDYAIRVNAERMAPPLDEDELERLISNACKFPLAQPEAVAVLGKKTEVFPVDWRSRYHSLEEMRDAPPASFLIDGFLQLDSITALAAPVGQRKSLISLNIAHSLCTGEPLFGHFKVVQKPSRVLYLCPEMGLASFTTRLKKIGLLDYVGKTLFCLTMNSEPLRLDELTDDELDGAVVIIDTAVRYLEGDENSSEDMRRFAESVFRVKKQGGGKGAVLLLHHSGKGTKESSELTLENAMRGSGELGAFVTSCWATRLQDPSEPYKSNSYLTNVKQRDFESKPFEVSGDENCRLHIVEQPGGAQAVLQQRNRGNAANKDGMDDAAMALIRANQKLGAPKLSELLAEHGIKRGRTWCGERKIELLRENDGMMP